MTAVLPSAFFFRFAVPVMLQPDMPRSRGDLLNLSESCRLPAVDLVKDAAPFADVRLGWNENGLGVFVEVRGKKMPVSCRSDRPLASDGLQIWIDTRNTQSIHRASRYCHHFCLLPDDGSESFMPFAMELAISRARDQRKLSDADALTLQSKPLKDGYRLEAWLPAKLLTGYDPEANPQLGFYYLATDAELGRQFLTVSDEFPFDQDPSVWSTLELVSE